jgi:adenine C2-methylase RlmN of 23S rRNA A2503 and tRNA A37
MIKQFVQVSAHKDSNNFAHCSNLSLMANEKLTAEQALRYLQDMADDYARRGYTVEWIRNDFDSLDEEIYGELFV